VVGGSGGAGGATSGSGGTTTGGTGSVTGTGNTTVPGTGGAGAVSSGGATVTGSGGSADSGGVTGTGNTTVIGSGGSGGSVAASSGGAPVIGSGGNVAVSSGGGPDPGTGGAVPTSSGGAPDPGTGGTVVSSSGGATVPGSGGVDGAAGAPAAGGDSGGGAAGTAGLSGSGTCDDPYMIATDVAHTDITVDTATGRTHDLDLPCAQNSTTVVLSFILTESQLVYADTFGAGWNTALFFADSCDASAPAQGGPGTSVCSDDACGTNESQAVAVLGYGQHYLVVSGASGASGTVTVHFQHTLIGNGPLTLLPAGSGTVSGTTGGVGASNQCQASAPDNSYWWVTCPSFAGGTFRASTCNGASFDTVLAMNVPRSGTSICADDDPSCGVQSTVSTNLAPGAGLQVLTVDGNTGGNWGPYTLTYTRP